MFVCFFKRRSLCFFFPPLFPFLCVACCSLLGRVGRKEGGRIRRILKKYSSSSNSWIWFLGGSSCEGPLGNTSVCIFPGTSHSQAPARSYESQPEGVRANTVAFVGITPEARSSSGHCRWGCWGLLPPHLMGWAILAKLWHSVLSRWKVETILRVHTDLLTMDMEDIDLPL